MNQMLPTEIIDVIEDPRASPEARGGRLKRVRNLANLSRREMCDAMGLNINTLKGWELGRHGGLTVKGTEKVIQRIAQEGVHCTLDWLLYEIGAGPTVITDFIKTKAFWNPEHLPANFSSFEEEKLIAEELQIFRQHYRHTIDFIVQDDGMLPLYRNGNYVAGVQRFSEDIDTVLEENCIVQTEEGIILLRHLRPGSKKGHYNLICINTHTTLAKPVLYDVTLVSAAPVLWQRRKNLFTKSS